MQRNLTNAATLEAFLDDPLSELSNKTGSLWSDGQGTLYSYGTHFPLAWIKQWHPLQLWVNDAQSTMTTTQHRNRLTSRAASRGINYVLTDARAHSRH